MNENLEEMLSEVICVHCKKEIQTRPRNLCYGCYDDKEIRKSYPILPKDSGRRGYGFDLTGGRPIPKEPTDAPPGSPRKIAVLRQRASRGEELWHPNDINLFNIGRFIRSFDNIGEENGDKKEEINKEAKEREHTERSGCTTSS